MYIIASSHSCLIDMEAKHVALEVEMNKLCKRFLDQADINVGSQPLLLRESINTAEQPLALS